MPSTVPIYRMPYDQAFCTPLLTNVNKPSVVLASFGLQSSDHKLASALNTNASPILLRANSTRSFMISVPVVFGSSIGSYQPSNVCCDQLVRRAQPIATGDHGHRHSPASLRQMINWLAPTPCLHATSDTSMLNPYASSIPVPLFSRKTRACRAPVRKER